MLRPPFADVLDFMRSHDTCGPIALELGAADLYVLTCTCGAAIERPIPGPDARYWVIFKSLPHVSEN